MRQVPSPQVALPSTALPSEPSGTSVLCPIAQLVSVWDVQVTFTMDVVQNHPHHLVQAPFLTCMLIRD